MLSAVRAVAGAANECWSACASGRHRAESRSSPGARTLEMRAAYYPIIVLIGACAGAPAPHDCSGVRKVAWEQRAPADSMVAVRAATNEQLCSEPYLKVTLEDATGVTEYMVRLRLLPEDLSLPAGLPEPPPEQSWYLFEAAEQSRATYEGMLQTMTKPSQAARPFAVALAYSTSRDSLPAEVRMRTGAGTGLAASCIASP
jgi:hypothetical protein